MAEPQDSLDIILGEVEKVRELQIDNFQTLATQAGNVLSILIGTLSATLTVSAILAHPPSWALALPGALLITGVGATIATLIGSSADLGPEAESLMELRAKTPTELKELLIDFYTGLNRDNRLALQKKRIFYMGSLFLLLGTVASIIIIAADLYSVKG